MLHALCFPVFTGIVMMGDGWGWNFKLEDEGEIV